MKKKLSVLTFSLLLILTISSVSLAHFQMIIPSDELIDEGESGKVDLQLIFTHPMSASHTMEMDKPDEFGVLHKGRKKDLTGKLEAFTFDGARAWKASYKTRSFGDYVFYVKPAPYWEKLENKYITQCTKVVVNKLAVPTDWDSEVGLPAEIVPLTRPYALWTGNVFQAVVKKYGEPVPYAEVEIEYFNSAAYGEFTDNSGVEIPAAAFEVQSIKADSNGVITFGIPKAGWWGFAALMEGEKVNVKDHEIGAVTWIKAYDMN